MADAKRIRVAHNFQDLTAQQFGRWTVISRAENTNGGSSAWLCRCQCGNELVVLGKKLRFGHSRSCGCLRSDSSAESHRTHGLSKTAEYKIWKGIIKRCENPKSAHYAAYGGRGVSIFAGWRNDFPAFLACVGKRPSSKHSIDRYPDQNGNYEPGNVRWATQTQQARNLRRNCLLTLNSETLTMSEWSERTGVSYGTLKDRIKQGWSHERALITPVSQSRSRKPTKST